MGIGEYRRLVTVVALAAAADQWNTIVENQHNVAEICACVECGSGLYSYCMFG